MGKIRTRVLGLEEVEEEQKKKQKVRSEEKKAKKEVKSAPVEKIEKKEEQPKKKKEAKKQVSKKKKGKNYQKVYLMKEKGKAYRLSSALELVKKMKYTAFDESVELHVNVDTVGLKGEAELPFSTGKTVRVVVVDDVVLAEIAKGKFNFDVLVTHPSYMPKLTKFAKVLGPKGLMPNPKAGTISPKPEEVVKKFAKGTVRWKTEAKFPLIHLMVGKLSHEDTHLIQNAEKLINSIGKKHIKQAYLKSTMSPSILLEVV